MLDEKQCDEYQVFCKDAEKSLLKIEKILNQHLKYNAAKILSKDELEEIEREKLIEKLENELDESEDALTVDELKSGVSDKLKAIQLLESLHESTMKLVQEAGSSVNRTQTEAVEGVGRALEFVADR